MALNFGGKWTRVRLFEAVRPVRAGEVLRDAVAGVVLAAMDIPQTLGYTRIAGMPLVTGLYTLLAPLLGFAAFGSSRYLVVAADSATAAILAGGLAGMAPEASPRYVALAGMTALLTALFLFIARLLELGFIADFLPRTVLTGFLTGVGVQVGIAVLGETLGIAVSSHRTPIQLWQIAHGLPGGHLPTLAVSLSVFISVLIFKRATPRAPGPLLVVVLACAASAWWHLASHGVAIIGPVAGGLPRLTWPMVGWRDAIPLSGIAASCAIMIVAQSAAVARFYATRHNDTLDENHDLLGLSAANAAAALTGTFVVNGSPTQTAMVEGLGARSQIAQISAAAAVAVVLLFLTKPLEYLPVCVLGTLVLIVALRLIDLRGLFAIRRESPQEFALAAITAAVVIVAGVEPGIVLAMVMSLLRIVHHSYHPRTGVMVQDVGNTWKLIPGEAGVVTEPGLVLYRFGAALFYANAARFSEEIRTLVGPVPSLVQWVVVDSEAITHIDYSAARVITELQKTLAAGGVTLGFARIPWDCRSDFDRHHLSDVIPPTMIFDRLHDAIEAFNAHTGAA